MMHKCRICGKTDKKVEMLIGGMIGYSHEKCRKWFDRHIEIFLEFVVTLDSGAFYLGEELVKAHDRVYRGSEGKTI